LPKLNAAASLAIEASAFKPLARRRRRASPATGWLLRSDAATIMETKRQRRAQRSRFALATAKRLDLDGEPGDGRGRAAQDSAAARVSSF